MRLFHKAHLLLRQRRESLSLGGSCPLHREHQLPHLRWLILGGSQEGRREKLPLQAPVTPSLLNCELLKVRDGSYSSKNPESFKPLMTVYMSKHMNEGG